MFDFNTDHKALVWTMFIVYLGITVGIAIVPAYQMQNNYEPLPNQPKMTQAEQRGEAIYVAEGCIACHTQQVRNIEMDAVWGKRPAIPQDFAYSKQRPGIWLNTASLLGSERTGPDLTNIGNRQPSQAWQLLHLYNPRAVVEESVMPSYEYLFKEVDSMMVRESDVVVKGIPKEFFNKPGKEVIATDEALALVAYLKSLKQPELPEGMEVPEFIPYAEVSGEECAPGTSGGGSAGGPNGKTLYANTCATCHQGNGKGVPGAFPPLAGNPVVNAEDPTNMIKIILEGQDVNPDYAAMPGWADQLTDEEVAAIMTYERSSWGNDAPAVSAEEVKKVREELGL